MQARKEFKEYLQHFTKIVNEALKEYDISVETMMVTLDNDEIMAHFIFRCGPTTFMTDAQLEQLAMDEQFASMMSAFEDPEVEDEQEIKLRERAKDIVKEIDDFWD
jgi:ferredoxin-NADP reductase